MVTERSLLDGNRLLLRDFVSAIASMHNYPDYKDFEDSVNVINATVKLLSTLKKIPADLMKKTPCHRFASKGSEQTLSFNLEDPMIQLAMFFAGIIHKLGFEPKEWASNNPVTVNMAWDLFMDPGYGGLRDYIFENEKDLKRFRALVNVFVEVATDSGDLRRKHDECWEKIFGKNAGSSDGGSTAEYSDVTSAEDAVTKSARQAQLVAELVIQASCDHHYFQHWKLFLNRSKYQFGLHDKLGNPCEFFFERELAYFDQVIVPMANKIIECEFFEICCREFLDYALSNRSDWEKNGAHIVQEWGKNQSLTSTDDLPRPPVKEMILDELDDDETDDELEKISPQPMANFGAGKHQMQEALKN
jgi:hypothetical protein